jgi:predicted transcriptional regulator
LDFEDKCNIKQGYLAQVLSSTQNPVMKKQLITARPSFVVLNKKTLTLFANENVKSLLNSFPISQIRSQSVALTWDSTFCWQVIKADKDTKEKITLKDPGAVELNTLNVLVTLCASDDKER